MSVVGSYIRIYHARAIQLVDAAFVSKPFQILTKILEVFLCVLF